jgi:putrescine transport system permease protein
MDGTVFRSKPGWGRRAVLGLPYAWLLLFCLVPFLIVFKISFAEFRLAMPPYGPLFERLADGAVEWHATLASYRFLLGDTLYGSALLYSLQVAAVSTLLCLLLAYPMALGIARSTPARRSLLLMLVVLPFWTSFLLRVYAWIGLLKHDGVINNLLLALGLVDRPVAMMQTDFAVYIGIVYSYLPFMILPLYSNLEKHDPSLLEAAADLGAAPARAFLRVTLPLSLPGIIAGSLLVFIPAVGEYVIPALLGPTDQLMIGRVLSDEFFANAVWPVSSAVAVVLLLLLVAPILLLQRYQQRDAGDAT